MGKEVTSTQTESLMLLPAPPDAETCRRCKHASMHGDCMLWRDPDGLFTQNAGMRLDICLAAEQAARSQAAELARLRRVATWARVVIENDASRIDTLAPGHELRRLRAELEKK